MTPTLTDDGVVATLTGSDGISVVAPTGSEDTTVSVSLRSTWSNGIAAVCNNTCRIPTELMVALPADVQSGTTIQITQPNTMIELLSGQSGSIGFQWYVVNAHTTASVTIATDTNAVLYGPTTIQPLQCALVRQCSTNAFLVIVSFRMEMIASLLATVLSTDVRLFANANDATATVTAEPSGASLILSTASATVQLTPNAATAGSHWYVANATSVAIAIVAGTNTNNDTAVVFGGSSIPAGRAILIRQFSSTRFVVIGIPITDSVKAVVYNSTVGVSSDGLLQLPDDAQHPNGSTVLVSGSTANTSVRIISIDSGGTRSWYVVNNTNMEIPIVPTATTLAAPDLRGSTYIPVGGVLLLRQYSTSGFMSIVSHPADATPNVVSGGSYLPSQTSAGTPIRNGSTIDLSSTMNIYSDSRTVGYTWFLNNNSTQPLPLIPSQRLPVDTVPTIGVSTASAFVPAGQMAILHQIEASRYLLVQFEIPRTVCTITTNNTTLDGGYANRFCLLNLTGQPPFIVALSASLMLDGGEIEVFNNCGSNITFTSTLTLLSRSNSTILPHRGGLMIKQDGANVFRTVICTHPFRKFLNRKKLTL